MKNMKRILTEKQLADHYVRKFSAETNRPLSAYEGKIWVIWDSEKRAYCLRGESLPAHPDMASQYPNGWGLCDYVSPTKANQMLGITAKQTKQILNVKVIQETDIHYNGEDSIGTFDMDAKSEYAIPLEHWDESHGYRYDGGFKFYNAPIQNYTGESAEDIRKYVEQDYASMRSYNAGEWDYIGVCAVCSVQLIPNGVILTLSSGGLWRIESNAGDYLQYVGKEQLDELRQQLRSIGFSTRAISTAFESIKTEIL